MTVFLSPLSTVSKGPCWPSTIVDIHLLILFSQPQIYTLVPLQEKQNILHGPEYAKCSYSTIFVLRIVGHYILRYFNERQASIRYIRRNMFAMIARQTHHESQSSRLRESLSFSIDIDAGLLIMRFNAKNYRCQP